MKRASKDQKCSFESSFLLVLVEVLPKNLDGKQTRDTVAMEVVLILSVASDSMCRFRAESAN